MVSVYTNRWILEKSIPVTLAMTGASGAPYGLRLLERLLAAGYRVDLLISDAGREVIRQECALELPEHGPEWTERLADYLNHLNRETGSALSLEGLRHYARNDWYAPMASGSTGPRAMVVCPCSMGSLAAMARGLSDNLIERAADVALKEGWPLILVPRETPLSVIHLENLLTLARAGAVILPAAPGFYQVPESVEQLVDFVVDRILARLGVPGEPNRKGWGAGLGG
ncbi:MAG: UbiX family flavin prenyltransferase [Magnetococcales bacterium]|nr:UbiX family flavin prenyltransferase [Magnetococcales bacterium]